MFGSNIEVTQGETIYLSYNEDFELESKPFVAVVCFNMGNVLAEMVLSHTKQADGSYRMPNGVVLGAESELSVVVECYCNVRGGFSTHFIEYLMKGGYLVSPKTREVYLGNDSEFCMEEHRNSPEDDKAMEVDQREYEEMMGYM